MKKFWVILVCLVVLAVGWYFVYTHPKHINRSILGIEYRTGNPNGSTKPLTIQVNGTLQKSIKGVLTFHGTIELSGNSEPNPNNNRTLTVHFDGPGEMGWMVYGWWEKDGTPKTQGYGAIFINSNFSQVVILEDQKGWTTTNSLTIAGPASNRSQAVSISNDLMKNWLKGHGVVK